MRRANDNPRFSRKQDLFAAAAGALIVIASALDPAEEWFRPWVHRLIVIAGTTLIGVAIRGLWFRTGRGEDSERGEMFADEPPNRSGRAVLVALFAVHVLATLFFFPPADIVSERPVVTLDHAFHYYQARRANAVFPETGRLHAYDPHFMAGFPSGLFDLDVKALELFCAPFPRREVGRAMKLFLLGCYLSMVFTVYWGCRLFHLTQRESLLAVALLLVFWHWGRPQASHFRYAGMFSFICVSHLAVLVAGLFSKFLRAGSAVWWLVLGPVVYFVHPTAVVILAAPYAALIVLERRNLDARKLLVVASWCVLVVMVNSIWIIPLFEYAQAKTATDAFFQFSGARDLARILLRPGCLPADCLLALAVVGGAGLVRGARASTGFTISIAVVSLLAVAAYGVDLPGLDQLEPGRFLLSAIFFSAPLAGAGAARLLKGWDGLARRYPRLRWIATLAVLVILVSPIVLSHFSARTQYKRRLSTALDDEVAELVGALRRVTGPSARLMIEDGPAAMYGDVHLPGLLPALTGVEQIGGPYPYTFLSHHFATFEVERTMGRPLAKMTSREFWDYAALYNFRWVATASGKARDFMSRIASDVSPSGLEPDSTGGRSLEVVWRSGRYEVWRIGERPSFTGATPARVRADFDRIEVDLETPAESFTLAYHWMKGLRVDPPAVISPVAVFDDPVPFIRVEPNGATSVLIKY
jgi:hypothetical protein